MHIYMYANTILEYTLLLIVLTPNLLILQCTHPVRLTNLNALISNAFPKLSAVISGKTAPMAAMNRPQFAVRIIILLCLSVLV